MPAICKSPGCSRQALYGPQGGRATYCGAHKLDGQINVKATRCVEAGCGSLARYSSGGHALYCKKHAPAETANVKDRMCQEAGCQLTAWFGPPDGKPTHCRKHATDALVNLVNTMCSADGCKKQATFGPGNGKRVTCGEHALPDYVDLNNPICAEFGCKSQAMYGPAGGKKLYCRVHAPAGHENLHTPRCVEAGCKKCATYGLPGGKKAYCKKHAPAGSIYLQQPCTEKGCATCATYGQPGGGPTHCSSHAPKGHINVTARRCEVCHIFIPWKGGLCSVCNPDARQKTREMAVIAHLGAEQENLGAFVHDKLVDAQCGKERPDALYDCRTHFVIVEIDEDQHRGRAFDCEKVRMAKIVQALGAPVTFIRYNPDKYVYHGKNQDPPKQARLDTLAWVIKSEQKREPIGLVRVRYLYYDDDRKVPTAEDVIESLGGAPPPGALIPADPEIEALLKDLGLVD